MKNLLHFNNIFYTAVLTIIFFSGFDGSLLYQRTFLDNETHTLYEYAHFYFSVFGGWFVGYFLIRRMVDQYTPNYIFRVSLLIASLSIWIQYKTHHHSMERLFSQLIIDNVFCAVLLGLLSHSLIRIINGKNELYSIKSKKNYSVLVLLLGFIYSYTLTDEKLGSGFLLSTLIYFLAYLYFLINSIDKLDYQVKRNPMIPMVFASLIITASIAIVYFRVLESFKSFSEYAYPIMIFMPFLFFEATQHTKNRVKEREPITNPLEPLLEKFDIKKNQDEKEIPKINLRKKEPVPEVKSPTIGKQK